MSWYCQQLIYVFHFDISVVWSHIRKGIKHWIIPKRLSQLLSNHSGTNTYNQQEVCFALLEESILYGLPKLRKSLYPHAHWSILVFLWSPFRLKGQRLAEKCVEMYYDNAISQLNWNNDFILESEIKYWVDLTIYN